MLPYPNSPALIFALLCATTVSGLAPLSPNLDLYQATNSSIIPVLSPNSSVPASVIWGSQNLNGIKTPQCIGARFGFIENKGSCFDALRSIPTDPTTRLFFGDRNFGFFEVQLPHRFLSGR